MYTYSLVQTWGDVLVASFQGLLGGVLMFVPKFLFALVVFLIGLFVAVTLGRVVMHAIRSLKIDHVLRSLGMEEYLERAGWKLDSGAFVGGLVRWFFVLVFLLAALDVLELNAVADFLSSVVLTYVPQVIVAALVLLAGAVVGDLAGHLVSGSARAARMPSAGFLGSVARWAIWVFALVAALLQLGLFQELILTVVQAFVFMVAGAGALAFGLGGKDAAARYLEKLRSEMSNHHS